MRRALFVSYLLFAAAAGRAQNPVATVTSSAPFTLRGAEVTPGNGVPMWPILAGDNLKAGKALTVLSFPDGSVLTLEPGSAATIDFINGKPVFQLLSGRARYSLKSASAVQLIAANQTVMPTGLTGTLGGSGKAGGGGFWTPGHTTAAVVGISAAGAGAGYGISQATGGGPSVSPSK